MIKRPAHSNPACARRGFTFAEVMFAVAILGVGAAMIAGIFLTAIRQTQASVEQTVAATYASNAVAILDSTLRNADVASEAAMVQMVQSLPFSGGMSTGEAIVRSDPRYAWVALYRRDTHAPFAQLYVWVVRCRNAEAYGPKDLRGAGADGQHPATLQPREVRVAVTAGSGGNADTIRFVSGLSSDEHLNAVGEGAFVVIRSDTREGKTTGSVYRVAAMKDAATRTWELDRSYSLKDPSDAHHELRGYIIGRGWADPSDPAKGYAGPVQDVMLHQSLVALSGPASVNETERKEWAWRDER